MTDYLPFKSIKPADKEFSLGLTYYEIMDLTEKDLNAFLKQTPRKEIIDWLQWNDPNGVYKDEDSEVFLTNGRKHTLRNYDFSLPT